MGGCFGYMNSHYNDKMVFIMRIALLARWHNHIKMGHCGPTVEHALYR